MIGADVLWMSLEDSFDKLKRSLGRWAGRTVSLPYRAFGRHNQAVGVEYRQVGIVRILGDQSLHR
jgi:hypothetical protein